MAVDFAHGKSPWGSSVRQLQEDTSVQPFPVLCYLLRPAKLRLKAVFIAPPSTSARLAAARALSFGD